jgi:hypothetical protein
MLVESFMYNLNFWGCLEVGDFDSKLQAFNHHMKFEMIKML